MSPPGVDFTDFLDPHADADPAEVVALAQRRRPRSAKAKGKGKASAKVPASTSAAARSRQRRPAAARPVATPPPTAIMDNAPGPDQHRSLLPWVLILGATVSMVLAVTAVSWRRAPGPARLDGISFIGAAVPIELQDRWLTSFPGGERLWYPDAAVLVDFAEHLSEQPGIAEVENLWLTWRRDEANTDRPWRRLIRVAVRMREPVLPLRLASGTVAWIDAEGVVLPGILDGPSGVPELRNLERSGTATAQALLAVWPQLHRHLPAGYLSVIDLDGPLDRPGQTGIVLHAVDGTRILWGHPDEERFGISAADKVRHLAHAVRHLDSVQTINVRFGEAVAQVR